MRAARFLLLVLVAASPLAGADDLWLEAAGAESSETGSRVAVRRSFDAGGDTTITAGLSQFRFGTAEWTLLEGGFSRRIGDRGIVRASAEVGPGRIDGDYFRYRKAAVSGTVLMTQRWSAELSDTYVNIDDTVGHVVGLSVTRAFSNGLALTLNGVTSAGGIDSRQLGAKFRIDRRFSILGGYYGGETRDPVLLNEFGTDFGEKVVDLRQAYVGVGVPIGRYTLLTVFDVLELDDVTRRELTLVLQIPLGSRSNAR